MGDSKIMPSREPVEKSDAEMKSQTSSRNEGVNCAKFPRFRGVLTVVCCFAITLTCGISYSTANLLPYLTSYLRNATGDTSLDYSMTIWVDQSAVIMSSLISPFLGIVEQHVLGRLYFAAGWICFTVAFIGSYWALQSSFIATVCVSGLLQGLGSTILSPASIKLPMRWFPDRKGLVGGVALSGYGGGAFIWNQMITTWINPRNLQPDFEDGENLYFTQPEVLHRVPSCYLLIGGVLGGMQLVCLLLIAFPDTSRPADANIALTSNATQSTHRDGAVLDNRENGEAASPVDESPMNGSHRHLSVGSGSDDRAEAAGASQGVHNMAFEEAPERLSRTPVKVDEEEAVDSDELANRMTLLEVLKSRFLWVFFLHFVLQDFGFNLVRLFYKAYAQTFIHDDHLLSLAASTASVFNAVGRPVWGQVADRVGYLWTYLAAVASLSVLVSTFVLCELGGAAMFFTWMCLMYLAVGGVYMAMVPMFYGVFGSKNFIFSVSIIFTEGAVMAPALIYVSSAIEHAFGWHGVFLLAGCLLFLGLSIMSSILMSCGRSLAPYQMRALFSRQHGNHKTRA